MNVTEISVSYGGKVNIGNYQNVDVNISMTATLAPNEQDKDGAYTKLTELAAMTRAAVAGEVAHMITQERGDNVPTAPAKLWLSFVYPPAAAHVSKSQNGGE